MLKPNLWQVFIYVFTLGLATAVAEPEKSHEGEQKTTSESSARETNRFGKYDALVKKLEGWAEKSGEGKRAVESSDGDVTVTLSKENLSKSAELLKRIKWYRGKVADVCEASDKSAKDLGTFIDECTADGVLSEAAEGFEKAGDRYKLSLSEAKLSECRDQIADYFAEKRKLVADKEKFKSDWELEKKFNELFDIYLPPRDEKAAEKTKIDEWKFRKGLKEVSKSNLCQVDALRVADTFADKCGGNPCCNGKPCGGKGAYQYPKGGYQAPPGGYQPPPGGYQPPEGGYKPPVGGYRPPIGGYTPPIGGYERPEGGYNIPYIPPQNGYDPGPAPYQPQQPVYYPPHRKDRAPIPPFQDPYPYPQPRQQYPFFPMMPYSPPPPPILVGPSILRSEPEPRRGIVGGCLNTINPCASTWDNFGLLGNPGQQLGYPRIPGMPPFGTPIPGQGTLPGQFPGQQWNFPRGPGMPPVGLPTPGQTLFPWQNPGQTWNIPRGPGIPPTLPPILPPTTPGTPTIPPTVPPTTPPPNVNVPPTLGAPGTSQYQPSPGNQFNFPRAFGR